MDRSWQLTEKKDRRDSRRSCVTQGTRILELQLYRHLYLPRRRSSVGVGIGICNDSEQAAFNQVTHAGGIGTGIEEMRVVKDVVTLKPRFQFEALAYFHPFDEGRVEIPKSRSIELVSATPRRA